MAIATTLSISSTAEIMMTGIVRSTASARIRSRTSIAVHLRHHDVEQDEVDSARAASVSSAGAPVHRGLDLVAERPQAAREQVAVDLLVVDDEEAPRHRGDEESSGGGVTRRAERAEQPAEIRDLLLGGALAFLDDVGDLVRVEEVNLVLELRNDRQDLVVVREVVERVVRLAAGCST